MKTEWSPAKWLSITIMFIVPVIAAAWRENWWLLFIELVVVMILIIEKDGGKDD